MCRGCSHRCCRRRSALLLFRAQSIVVICVGTACWWDCTNVFHSRRGGTTAVTPQAWLMSKRYKKKTRSSRRMPRPGSPFFHCRPRVHRCRPAAITRGARSMLAGTRASAGFLWRSVALSAFFAAPHAGCRCAQQARRAPSRRLSPAASQRGQPGGRAPRLPRPVSA